MTLAGFKRLFIFVLTQAWNSISDYHPNNGFHIGLEYLSREFQDIQKVWFWYITMPNFSSRSILSEASSRIISWSSSVFYKISQALKPESFIGVDLKEIWYNTLAVSDGDVSLVWSTSFCFEHSSSSIFRSYASLSFDRFKKTTNNIFKPP